MMAPDQERGRKPCSGSYSPQHGGRVRIEGPGQARRSKLQLDLALQSLRHHAFDDEVAKALVLGRRHRWASPFYPGTLEMPLVTYLAQLPGNRDSAFGTRQSTIFDGIRRQFMQGHAEVLRGQWGQQDVGSLDFDAVAGVAVVSRLGVNHLFLESAAPLLRHH